MNWVEKLSKKQSNEKSLDIDYSHIINCCDVYNYILNLYLHFSQQQAASAVTMTSSYVWINN